MMFSNGPEGQNEVDDDFAVYSRFAKSKYLFHRCLCSGRYSKWETILIELPREFKEWWRTR